MNLEAVILYSGNDSRFAEACIKSLLELDIKTHVITYSHMWNGIPENKEKLQEPLNQFISNPLFYQYVIDWKEGHRQVLFGSRYSPSDPATFSSRDSDIGNRSCKRILPAYGPLQVHSRQVQARDCYECNQAPDGD